MGKIVAMTKSKVKPKPKFKYGLNEQISMLPRTVDVEEVAKHVSDYGIKRSTFYNDRKIPYASATAIPEDRLFIYCKVFDCTVDDLINYQPVKATSFRTSISKLKSPLR